MTLFILIALAGVVWYVESALVVPEVTVPSVIDKTEEEARALLAQQGIEVNQVLQEYKEGVDPGIVYEQSRPEGAVVKKGSLIDLTVSVEKPKETMPGLTGRNYEDAVQELLALGMSEDRIKKTEEFSEESVNEVIGQSVTEGQPFDPEVDTITLRVSKGQEMVEMPDLINKTRAEAEELIRKNKLTVAPVKEEPSFEVEKGRVTQQWPYDAGAAVVPGEEITIFVSTGYSPETIEYNYHISVAPHEEGKNSKIRITFTDARGENQEHGTETIKKTETLTVPLVLAPNKDGVVSVYRDGQLMDTFEVRYFDAKNGTVTTPEIGPAVTPDNHSGDGEEGAGPDEEPNPEDPGNESNEGNNGNNGNGNEEGNGNNDNNGNNGNGRGDNQNEDEDGEE